MRFEIVDAQLQQIAELLQLKSVAAELRRIKRSFVVVAQEMVVIRAAGSCGGEQMFWKNDARAGARSVRAIVAFADAIETIAGRDDPRVVGRALEIFAEIFKDRRIAGRDSSEIVEGLVGSGGEARRCDVVAEDSAIDDLREEGSLRNHFLHHVRDIFLAFGGEGFLIARAATEGDDDNFAFFHRGGRKSDRRLQERTAESDARRGPNEIAPRESELTREVEQIGGNAAQPSLADGKILRM